MKLATWNVKLEDPNFPLADINAAGYQAVDAGQKTYNGVAILSPTAAAGVSVGIPAWTIRKSAYMIEP